MKKIGIIYGSTTGCTADVADRIAKALGVEIANVYDAAKVAPSIVGEYDVLLLGSSTWGAGDMQPDMEDFIDGVQALSLRGKKIGLFGCGDEKMTLTFGGALGEMYKRLKDTGAEFIGAFNTDGYHFKESPAYVDGICVGLVIDETNHPESAENKIKDWCKVISSEI